MKTNLINSAGVKPLPIARPVEALMQRDSPKEVSEKHPENFSFLKQKTLPPPPHEGEGALIKRFSYT